MLRLMKNEWRKVRFPVLFVTLLLCIVMSVLSCTLYREYRICYDIEAWEIGTELIDFLFPLLVTLPLCWNLYYEQKNHFLFYVRPRVKLRRYLWAKWQVQAAGAFLILFFPYVCSALFALYVKEPVEPYVPPAEGTAFEHVFLGCFTGTPLLYAVILSLWKGILGILVFTLGFVLALYEKNIFVILTGPFIYVVLENFILSVLRLEKYRLIVSFAPTSVAADAYTWMSAVCGPALLLFVIGILRLYKTKLRRYSNFTEL